MDEIRQLLTFDHPASRALIALAVACASFLAMTIAIRVASSRLNALAGRTKTHWDDTFIRVLSTTKPWLIALAALLIGAGFLDLSARWTRRVDHLWFVVLALQVALWANQLIGLGLSRYVERHSDGNLTHVGASATLLSWGMRTALWTIVALAMLSNLGVNITAFVASLGVGGVAVALAVQNILGDLFASLSIAVDKPFEVGDAIAFGGLSGTVEQVGLKTTRIRSTSGEQIVVSNTELLKQTINNYKRMEERRVVLKFGLSYDTSVQQAREVPQLVRQIIESSPDLRFDRSHFQALGESSLDFETVYFVRKADYALHVDLQQMINLRLLEEFERMGVQLAYPTRTVVIQGAQEPLAGSAAPTTNAQATVTSADQAMPPSGAKRATSAAASSQQVNGHGSPS